MIIASGLTFGYQPGTPIIRELDATFAEGTSTAFVGRSGSGKSTFLYLVGLMLTATGGSLTFDGRETVGMKDWQRAELRASTMGLVFQDALLDPARSVLDNILEGGLYNGRSRPSTKRALDLLEQFEVTVDPHRRPGQISGGQAQRVALCRAFINEPRFVLADEPTGNLDSHTAGLVMDALHQRARDGAVVLLATHDREQAARCHSVIEPGYVAAT